MNKYNLPLEVQNGDILLKIRAKCDFQTVLECIEVFDDNDLTDEEKAQCLLFIFFENNEEIQDVQSALDEALKIIGCEQDTRNTKSSNKQDEKPSLMSWIYDFDLIVPEINNILGYDIRDPNRYTHWWTVVSAYHCIPSDSTWGNVISIRSKKQKHKKLEKSEEEFCREYPEIVNLPVKFSQEEEDFFSLFERKGES